MGSIKNDNFGIGETHENFESEVFLYFSAKLIFPSYQSSQLSSEQISSLGNGYAIVVFSLFNSPPLEYSYLAIHFEKP